MTKRSFGDVVREGRLRKGISLRRLAAHTGIEFSRLSRIESGTRPAPDLSLLRKLAHALDLDLVGLLVSAGTSREVVDDLLWDERLRLGDALPDVAAYRPGDSALARKNTFRAPVVSRYGARCHVRFGRETLIVFSFSTREDLEIEIPPEAVIVFPTDPASVFERTGNAFPVRVRKVRRLGQVTNLVLEGRGFSLNALESLSEEDRPYCVAQQVFAYIPAAAIRTRPAAEEE